MFLIAHLASGIVSIYIPTPDPKSVVLSFVPRDVNGALNVDGTISIGSYENVEAAQAAAVERYTVPPDSWQTSQTPFGKETLEEHTPIVEGRHVRPSHD
jgi:hypothetical protein